MYTMTQHRPRMSRAHRTCCMLVLLMKSSSSFAPRPPRSCLLETRQGVPETRTSLHLMRDEDEGSSKKKGPFHHAVNILRKKKRRGREEESMHMLTTDEVQQTADLSSAQVLRDNLVSQDFILQNFETTGPTDIFPPSLSPNDVFPSSIDGSTPTKRRELTSSNVQDAIFQQPSIKPSKKRLSTKNHTKKAIVRRPTSKYDGGPLLNRMTRTWFQNRLTACIHRRSTILPQDLKVEVAPRAVVSRLCRGQFRCDASIHARRIVFPNIRMTGGTLEAKRMTINFLQGKPRYSNQFDIHASNITFTQDDLFESSCIRNGLARLLVRILSNAGLFSSKIQVTAVDIVPSGKISITGQADTGFGTKVPFEVRSGLGFASRGHVVRFPGLEVSLGPSLGVFMPVVPDIDLDIGHNARLHNVHVDGRRRRVTLSASATVTPTHTMKLRMYRQAKDSYAAHFSFDVGQWVTNLGNFTS